MRRRVTHDTRWGVTSSRRPEPGDDIFRRLPALVGVFREAPHDQRRQRGRTIGALELDRRRRLREMRRHLLLRSGGRVGRPTDQHLVCHQPQGIEIGPVIDARIGGHLFRRHVGRRAERHTGAGQPLSAGGVAHRLGDAEIDHQGVPIGEEDVLRLDVTVHHARRGRYGERVGDLRGHRTASCTGSCPLAGEPLAERLALHERHHVVEEHLRAGPAAMTPESSSPTMCGCCSLAATSDLLEEALGAEGRTQLRPQHFDRDFALVLEVLRPGIRWPCRPGPALARAGSGRRGRATAGQMIRSRGDRGHHLVGPSSGVRLCK